MSEDKFGRDMHKVTCSECGKETEVPFKPDTVEIVTRSTKSQWETTGLEETTTNS